MLRFSKPRDRQKLGNIFLTNPLITQSIALLLGSFETAALHRLVRDFIKKNTVSRVT